MVRHGGAPLAITLLLASQASTAPSPGSDPQSAVRISQEQGEALVREIGASVEQLRGLKFKTPVSMKVISGAQVRENFKAKMEPSANEEARHVTAAYVQLGLIPHGSDLAKAYLDDAEKDIDGYYEHGSKVFYLVDHTPPDDVRGVIAHELTHALEDQYYDLESVAKKAQGNDDRSTAITSLVEGSAMVVMFAFMSREQGQKKAKEQLNKVQSERAERTKTAPSFTQRTLVLPYLLGFSFLLHGKPWDWAFGNGVLIDDIQKAYADPPLSTREILHPEQYWVARNRLRPDALRLPDLSPALGKGWTKALENSIGELGLTVLSGFRDPIEFPWALLPTRWTNEAATGTVGDVYQHYVNGQRSLTVLLTRWETERDAWQFEQAIVDKGQYYSRFGVNLLLLSGDVENRGDAIALAAFQGMNYWPDR